MPLRCAIKKLLAYGLAVFVSIICSGAGLGCKCDPWLKVLEVRTGDENVVLVTIQTGTFVQNRREGTRIRGETISTVTFRRGNGELNCIGVDRGTWNFDLQKRSRAEGLITPAPLIAKGYVAMEQAGTQFLCQKLSRIPGNGPDGPWAITTQDGTIIASMQSIKIVSFKYPILSKFSWNVDRSEVVFRSYFSPLELEPFVIKVWNYGQTRNDLDTSVVDLSAIFSVRRCGYYPKAQIPTGVLKAEGGHSCFLSKEK